MKSYTKYTKKVIKLLTLAIRARPNDRERQEDRTYIAYTFNTSQMELTRRPPLAAVGSYATGSWLAVGIGLYRIKIHARLFRK